MIEFKIPTSFEDVRQMLHSVWDASPLGAGILFGFAVVGLYKLVSVRFRE